MFVVTPAVWVRPYSAETAETGFWEATGSLRGRQHTRSLRESSTAQANDAINAISLLRDWKQITLRV